MIGVGVPDSGLGLRGQEGEPDCDRQSADNAWSDATLVRDADAARRDEVADARDLVAEARDQVAGAADGEASALRDAAADDRRHAAEDRKHAAGDRQAASEELATAHIDYLTGVLRRRAGLAAIQREMDRPVPGSRLSWPSSMWTGSRLLTIFEGIRQPMTFCARSRAASGRAFGHMT